MMRIVLASKLQGATCVSLKRSVAKQHMSTDQGVRYSRAVTDETI
jgi:hypothetical protein